MSFLRKVFLLIAALALVGFLVGEGVMWIFYPQPETPETRFRFDNQSLSGTRAISEYHINAQGLRGLNWGLGGRSPNSQRVLCVGGASTDLFLHTAEDTWWGRLWAALKENPDLEIELACYLQHGVPQFFGG